MVAKTRGGLWRALRVCAAAAHPCVRREHGMARATARARVAVHARGRHLPGGGRLEPVTRDYLARLDRREFAAIDAFFAAQAKPTGSASRSPFT